MRSHQKLRLTIAREANPGDRREVRLLQPQQLSITENFSAAEPILPYTKNVNSDPLTITDELSQAFCAWFSPYGGGAASSGEPDRFGWIGSYGYRDAAWTNGNHQATQYLTSYECNDIMTCCNHEVVVERNSGSKCWERIAHLPKPIMPLRRGGGGTSLRLP